jgi:hypothetical protein
MLKEVEHVVVTGLYKVLNGDLFCIAEPAGITRFVCCLVSDGAGPNGTRT